MIFQARVHRKSGFTLIETIIYIAIMALLLGAGVSAAFYIIDASQKNKMETTAEAEGNFVLGKINWAFSGATDLSISGGALYITKAGLPGGENPLKFFLDGAYIKLQRGAGVAETLNSAYAPASALTFTAVAPYGVDASFTLGGKNFSIRKYLRK